MISHRLTNSAYLPQYASRWQPKTRTSSISSDPYKTPPIPTCAAESTMKNHKNSVIARSKKEQQRNRKSRIISRKLQEFEQVLEKSYRKENQSKSSQQAPHHQQQSTANASEFPTCGRGEVDPTCNLTTPKYDPKLQSKNIDLSSNTEDRQGELFNTKGSARRILKTYSPFIVPLPKISREEMNRTRLTPVKTSHGYIPLSPVRYVTHRLPKPLSAESDEGRIKVRPRLPTKRRLAVLNERSKSKDKSRENTTSKSTVRPANNGSNQVTCGSFNSGLLAPGVQSTNICSSPSCDLIPATGSKVSPSTAVTSPANLKANLIKSLSAKDSIAGGDVEPTNASSAITVDSKFLMRENTDFSVNSKSHQGTGKFAKVICTSAIASEDAKILKDSPVVTATTSKSTINSIPLKNDMKKAKTSPSQVSISLLTKIGICTAQPGTKEWTTYWDKYDRAIAQFKRSEAHFMQESKEFREDLDKYSKEAARLALEDAIFRQSIGLEPRQVHEVMGQPLMGLTTLNGFVFDRNYGPHRPQAFLTSVGSKGVRLELDLRGYDPDSIKIDREFNLMKIQIPPDNPKEPLKTVVIGMSNDYQVSDMEVYPIVNGWLVVEAAEKKQKHFTNNSAFGLKSSSE